MIPLGLLVQAYSAALRGGREVFRPSDISLPTDRRLAVLGRRRSGKTTLLKILAGKLRPDLAKLLESAQFSPVANAGGLFHPKLNVVDNVRFLADLYCVDAARMYRGLLEFCQIKSDKDIAAKSNDPALRRSLEVAAIMFLPFSCYLVDDAAHLSSEFVDRCFAAAEHRGAGLIFATSNARMARQHAQAVLVIAERSLHLFDDVEEASEFFGQRDM